MLSSPMHLLSLALFAISTLAAPAPASPRTPSRSLHSPSRPSKRVEWLTDFAPALLAGASVELAWTGGSGQGYVSQSDVGREGRISALIGVRTCITFLPGPGRRQSSK